ncbi:GTPase IMAP family member 7-like [Morone saxatilis]|uniref:GTPase IMAP family member 7-like n=1 Tax=Morone saxatilis TaxID=34816 RepID=UPI0015E2011B|nr:GTPase IMAP family member 7-like [Morone saxatilis]
MGCIVSMVKDTDTIRVVILGKTGAGKSSLANTIFGEDVFKINHGFNSETTECQSETRSVNRRKFTLIDTPGFFDTDRSEEELKREIVRCIIECAPGPHAFLIVLKVEKFTEQEQAVIKKILKYFSEEALKYATVVFTHGDQLPEGQTIEDHVRQNELVNDLVEKCGRKYVVIDNKYLNKTDKKKRVKELLHLVKNKESYTNEMLIAVAKEIQQEEKRNNNEQSSGNMSKEETREQAKRSVSETILTTVSSIATGVMLGPLFSKLQLIKLADNNTNLVGIVKLVAEAVGGAAVSEGTAAAVEGAALVMEAVMGGKRGYEASKGADTPWEASKRAAVAVKEHSKSQYDKFNMMLN